ncbi:hypothetical protein TGPRC2_244460 [Toxoplasma gondii TgCatPRC2]|uniref:Uncharacterized protein n=2 Tax=Toxoplasma gondii TaxID=5811 RepID=A0A151HRK7_TOXGO|nr:hypothetical protein TGME49_244460 [Toxoplasma gondii ME49]EPT30569.1 hypothetical protein TGME49_244460 [Toxoplasma gondii ME49]KYK71988.1 hypothetical protein TGPRC2_244460 [Toxoplasma gondii TgCatPRC2]|eukprot:XP_018637553.1 hypothetical protein TGME49_244460 [Toxoplasma gondii ME49]
MDPTKMPVLRDLGTAPGKDGILLVENAVGSQDHQAGRGDDSNTTRASYASASLPARELSTTASGATTSSLKADIMPSRKDGGGSPRGAVDAMDAEDDTRSNGSDIPCPLSGDGEKPERHDAKGSDGDGRDGKQDQRGAQSTQAAAGASPSGASGKPGQAAVTGEKRKKKRGNSSRAAAPGAEAMDASPLSANGSGSKGGKVGDKSPASPRQAGQARSMGRRQAGASGSPAYLNGQKNRVALPHPPSPPSPGGVHVPPPPPLPLAYEMHLHVPQLSYQPIPPPSPAPVVPPEPSELPAALEALFTQENLQRDRFLATKIKPGDLLLDVAVLLAHPTVAAWNFSSEDIDAALERSQLTLSERTVEIAKIEEEAKEEGEGKAKEGNAEGQAEKKATVKCIALGNLLAETRNTLVFRDVPENLSEETLRTLIESAPLFQKNTEERVKEAKKEAKKEDKENATPKPEETKAVGPVRSIRREVNNTWFVVVEDENVAQELALWLRTQQIDDKPIRVGIKATHSLQRIVSSSQQYTTSALGSVPAGFVPGQVPLSGVAMGRYGAHPLSGYPHKRSGASAGSLPLQSGRFVPQYPPCTLPYNATVFASPAPPYGRNQVVAMSPGNYAASGVATSRPAGYDGSTRSPALRPFAALGQTGKREKGASGKGGKGASAGATPQAGARGEGKSSSRNSAHPSSSHSLRGTAPYMASGPWIPFDLSWSSAGAPVPPPGWQPGSVLAGEVPQGAASAQPVVANGKEAGSERAASPADTTPSSVAGETACSSPPPSSMRNDREGADREEKGETSACADSDQARAQSSGDEKASDKPSDAAAYPPVSPSGSQTAPCSWVPGQPCYYDPVMLSYNGGYLPAYDANAAATAAYGCWAQGGPLAGTIAVAPSGGDSPTGLPGTGRGGGNAGRSRSSGSGAGGGGASAAARKPSTTQYTAQQSNNWTQQTQAAANSGGWKLVTGRRGKAIKDEDWNAGPRSSAGDDHEGHGGSSSSSRSHHHGNNWSSLEQGSGASCRKSRGVGSAMSSPRTSGAPFLGGGDFPSLSAAANARPTKPCGYKKAFRNFTAAEVVDICSNYEATCPNGIEIPQDIRDLPQTGCFLALDTPRQGAACWTAFTARQRQKDAPSSLPDSSGNAGGSKNGGKANKKNAKQNTGLASKTEEGHAADGKKGEASKSPPKGDSTEPVADPAAKEKNGANSSSEASVQGQDVFCLLRTRQNEAERGQEKSLNGVKGSETA